MKKFVSLILLLCCLSGCAIPHEPIKTEPNENYVYGVWISCYELEDMAAEGFYNAFEKTCEEAKVMGLNTLYVHIKAMDTCFYESQFLPIAEWCKGLDRDVLEFMVNTAHSYGLLFHAWINPYRLSHRKDFALSEHFGDFIEDYDYARLDNGVYLNPASSKAKTLILNVIKEVINGYDVDGIHLDDYFYPTTDASFDSAIYGEYIAVSSNPLGLDDFRRAQVNALILGVKQTVAALKKTVVFSVSPAADIQKNYGELYADVAFWCEQGIIDVIIPQIYFGFYYPLEKFCFENLVVEWIKCVQNTDVSLHIGLAPYKLGTENEADKKEWENGVCVVSDQLKNIFARGEISGIAFFSYSSLINKNELFIKQRQNITKEISDNKEKGK